MDNYESLRGQLDDLLAEQSTIIGKRHEALVQQQGGRRTLPSRDVAEFAVVLLSLLERQQQINQKVAQLITLLDSRVK